MSFVKYEPKGNIAYLIIDREKALNALNSQVLADLDAALDAVDLSEIRCLIVRGAGEKSFVAGADIAQMKELSKEEAEAFGKQGNDVMRKLEALLICANASDLLIVSGTGEVIEPDDGIAAIGSGGMYALAAARALQENTELPAVEIAEKALRIASGICVYTNSNIVTEEV